MRLAAITAKSSIVVEGMNTSASPPRPDDTLQLSTSAPVLSCSHHVQFINLMLTELSSSLISVLNLACVAEENERSTNLFASETAVTYSRW